MQVVTDRRKFIKNETIYKLGNSFLFSNAISAQEKKAATPIAGRAECSLSIKLQPEISQRELGYLLDMRKQSLGELLGKLEGKSYIARTAAEDDRPRDADQTHR